MPTLARPRGPWLASRKKASVFPVAFALAGLFAGGTLALDHEAGAAATGQNAAVPYQLSLGFGPAAILAGVNSIATLPPLPTTGNRLALNIADIVNHPESPLRYAAPAAPAPKTWDGTGAMPGAFKAPWSFGSVTDSNFDPSFKTSYWSEAGGFINAADAPWNTGLAGSLGYGPAIFDRGLSYAGRPDFSAVLPVWNTPVATTTASLPSGTAGSGGSTAVRAL